ncbi:MAG: prepilin-type N-terminal cleavage/methylation domain-containing protein [Candidatus Liptonbacteria bacterium]
MYRTRKGFTLLEIIITMAILTITTAGMIAIYSNTSRSADLDSAADTITFNLKHTQARAMAGESGLRWGIRFVNSTSDYYEIFSTPTDYEDLSMATDTVNYLSGGISFSAPTASSTVVFEKITGAPTNSTTTTITLSSPAGETKSVYVNSSGGIY